MCVSVFLCVNKNIFEQPITILDWRDDSGMSDNLYIQSDRNFMGCMKNRCSGSKVTFIENISQIY